MNTSKVCTKCDVEQPMNEFHDRKDTSDGKEYRCKTCRAKYDVWHSMMYRCYKINHKYYINYGGRGIKVCDEWLTYKGMCDWIENNWVKGLEIDRTDNNKGYSPSNCRFVTPSANHLNKRKQKHCSSNYRGVHWFKRDSKWRAQVKADGKLKHIGYFTSEIDSAKAYDKYVILKRLPNQLNFK